MSSRAASLLPASLRLLLPATTGSLGRSTRPPRAPDQMLSPSAVSKFTGSQWCTTQQICSEPRLGMLLLPTFSTGRAPCLRPGRESASGCDESEWRPQGKWSRIRARQSSSSATAQRRRYQRQDSLLGSVRAQLHHGLHRPSPVPAAFSRPPWLFLALLVTAASKVSYEVTPPISFCCAAPEERRHDELSYSSA